MKYHKDGTQPNSSEIFVFGSNEFGIHGAGAAKAALSYGAKRFIGFGPVGRTFAIPTKDWDIESLPLETIEFYVDRFLAYAKNNNNIFFMTRIGCGLAGYKDSDIAPMFKTASANFNMPNEWKEYLE